MFHIQTANDQYRLKDHVTGCARSTELSVRYIRRYQRANQSQPSMTQSLHRLNYIPLPEPKTFELTEKQLIAFDEAMLASYEIVFDGILVDS